jgi:putative membrane protein
MSGAEKIKPGLYPTDTVVRVEPLAPADPAGPPPLSPGEPAELDTRLGPAPRRRHPGRWFARALAVLIVALLGVQAGFFIADMFDRNVLLGAGFSALIALVGAGAGAWIWAELSQLRRLDAVDRVRDEASLLLASDGYGQAARFIAHVKPLFSARPALKERFVRLEDMILDTHSDREVVALFQREILRPLDQAAYRAVTRAAQWTAVGVSVSPVAAIDALLAIARSLRMVREIGEVYGFRPGFTSTLFLARHVLKNAALVSTTDVIGTLWVQHLGGRLAGLVSTRLAEGVYAAVRVARLGLLTIETCRPVPFGEGDKPGLDQLRKDIFARLVDR